MRHIKGYELWLNENVDTTDREELYSLHHAVAYKSSIAGFNIIPGNDEPDTECQFLTSPAKESTLIISTEKMRKGLLKHIQGRYMDGMDAETWFDFQRRLEDNN
jgi:hypothetical protein